MNQFACFVGLLVVMMSASFMALADQGNTSEKMNYVAPNNVSPTNISTNNNSADSPITDTANLTAPDSLNRESNVSINVTAGPSQPVFAALIAPAFTLGTGLKDNSSAYKLGGKAQTVKNLSNMWYIIQGTPHGYT
jgi:GH24 family phage-related lysozyme (muramidase)